MKLSEPVSPPGYTFTRGIVYGSFNIYDWAGNRLRESIPIGEAKQLVRDWQDGTKNPYLTT